MEKNTILLVEDHELTRQGLAYALNNCEHLNIIAEAENGQEAIELNEKYHPDIILMDIILPVLNGIDATKKIKETSPDTKIIMLTSQGDQQKLFNAFASGADSYCMKNIKIDELISVIDLVLKGGVWIDPGVANHILNVLPMIPNLMAKAYMEKQNDWSHLTEREIEILQMVAKGQSNKDIADELCVSIFTVKNHVSSIIQKLSVEDRTQAAIIAIKKGLA